MNGKNNTGWVKIHRKLLDSPVWVNHNLARFWTWCLLRASHNEFTVRAGYSEIALNPGEFVYSHAEASASTGLSQKVVRTCLDSLGKENDPLVGRKRAGKYTIVTVLKWGDYQIEGGSEGRKTGSEKAAKGQGLLIGSKKNKKQGEKIDVVWSGESLEIPSVLMEKYRTKYPRLDIPSIVIDAERWLLKRPAKAAEYKSFDAFLNNWLRREDEKRRERDPDADYELTGDSLAAAQECANLFGRAANE